ncbi:MutS-related protein [Clostridium ganghwense]|uniref:DNA mismatch repair protein n=1 Tax=Clostridium ganghwense TaxID=312089 RepID=A0ABT4CRK4_9CLOT|nr:MutS family DNA mismatch repair protein [Clostridium ganghwense]MCY6371695.1 DNA mismatch repair protein [Clostridium ganghwense]
MIDIKETYSKRKERYKKILEKQNKIINIISSIRMILFISAVVFPLISYYSIKNIYLSLFAFCIFVLGFIIMVLIHDKVINNRDLISNIYSINMQCIERVEGRWKEFEDDGEEYRDENHPYSNDLDIFGRASLFQYINDTTTYIGREKLKKSLTNSSYSEQKIYKRQEAIKELSKMIGFRQRLKGTGLRNFHSGKNVESLLKWTKQKHNLYDSKFIKIISIALPVVTLGAIIYYFLGIFKSYYIPLLFITINLIILRINKNERNSVLDTVYIYRKQINDYYNMLKLIEKMNFKSTYLKELKMNLTYKNSTASQKIIKLNKLSDLILDRKNLIYFILNYVFLWDYHCMINLEKWRKLYGENFEKWLETIGTIEELASFSTLAFDNSDWTMPNFKNDEFVFKGKNMGHPLLGNKKVCNDLTIGKGKKVVLITGSNMSGKSTFLRTAGINLVLAYAGAPVCAKNFECSIMEIFTCMRISDNLEKNISSFYGELLRIKELVRKTKEGRNIFFLLDEIFKGTNSIDRHTGARILINKLSKEKVLGMISTHDLELGSLQKENYSVINYHFEEYYRNNKIYFDYKLRGGVSTTRNAMYLMKIAGIVDTIPQSK